MNNREFSELANDCADLETKKFIIYMCRKCKFYQNDSCTKKRAIRECAKKGLKNKD